MILAQKRHYLIFGALLLTLIAAAFAPDREVQVIGVARERAGAPVSAATSGGRVEAKDDTLLNLNSRRLSEEGIELFKVPPPSPPMAAMVAMAAPTMPPLPFKFLGKMTLGKADSVMLAEKNNTLIAAPGETLMDTWRMDSIDAETLSFTYLPLATTAVLKIGSAN